MYVPALSIFFFVVVCSAGDSPQGLVLVNRAMSQCCSSAPAGGSRVSVASVLGDCCGVQQQRGLGVSGHQ